jgi:hypothetical protein
MTAHKFGPAAIEDFHLMNKQAFIHTVLPFLNESVATGMPWWCIVQAAAVAQGTCWLDGWCMGGDMKHRQHSNLSWGWVAIHTKQ